MSENKFTPGPWRIDLEDLGLFLPNHVSISSERHGALAQVVWKMEDDERSPEKEANAKLIAAAPELLAALELCLKNSEFRRRAGVESGPMIEREIEAARAAIANVKGEA